MQRTRLAGADWYNFHVLSHRLQRRLLIGVGVSAAALLCGLSLLTGAALFTTYQAADPPEAALVSDHSLYRLLPALHLRRDTSYRAAADFPSLYNWYSQRFQLGPESAAISACITMEKAETVAVIQQTITVMLCDAGAARMIFVTRSLTLRLR